VSAAELVERLTVSGYMLRIEGDALIVRPKPSPEVSAEIRDAKPAMVALIRKGLPASAHRYVLWRGATEPTLSVCIACGVPPCLHGDGALDGAVVVDDPNGVALVDAAAIVVVEVARQVARAEGDGWTAGGMKCKQCHRLDVVRRHDSICADCVGPEA
jgi:hypothetical protein